MLDATILEYLKRDQLLREGHFVYRSGRHSAVRLDRDRLLADPGVASRMGYALAKHFFIAKVTTIAAPSIWGAGLAQWVAYFLDPRAKVVYATPRDGQVTIAENLAGLIQGERVVLIDNLVISGETLARFDTEVAQLGGEVIGMGTLWNSGDPMIADHEVIGLLNSSYPAYLPADCPFCQNGDTAPEPVSY